MLSFDNISTNKVRFEVIFYLSPKICFVFFIIDKILSFE